ncbi:hypothetical protein ACFX2K_036053 [Malus domestica]
MFEPCVVVWNAMIDGFRKNGEMGCAVLLFESMPERDVVSWKSVISRFGRNGCGCAILSLFASVNYVSGFSRNGCSKNVISCIGCMVWLLCNQERREASSDEKPEPVRTNIHNKFIAPEMIGGVIYTMARTIGSALDNIRVLDMLGWDWTGL